MSPKSRPGVTHPEAVTPQQVRNAVVEILETHSGIEGDLIALVDYERRRVKVVMAQDKESVILGIFEDVAAEEDKPPGLNNATYLDGYRVGRYKFVHRSSWVVGTDSENAPSSVRRKSPHFRLRDIINELGAKRYCIQGHEQQACPDKPVIVKGTAHIAQSTEMTGLELLDSMTIAELAEQMLRKTAKESE